MSFFNQIGTGISRKNQFANFESDDDDDSSDDLDLSMKNSNVKKRKLEDSQDGNQISKFNFKPRSNAMPQENGENFQNNTSLVKKQQYKATLVQSKLPAEETMDPFISSAQTNFSKSVTEFNPPKFKTVATKESEAGAYYNIQNHPTAIMPKSSLAGLPSMIPSKPLKENKSKPIPNYKRKLMKNKEEDEEENIEVQESSGYRVGYQNAQNSVQKSSLAGLPNSIPSRPLKENKYKPIPNYKRKFMKNKEYEEEEESFDENPPSHPKTCAVPPNQFRTANHQLASNVLRKNGFQRKPDQPATCNSSFKSPLLRYGV